MIRTGGVPKSGDTASSQWVAFESSRCGGTSVVQKVSRTSVARVREAQKRECISSNPLTHSQTELAAQQTQTAEKKRILCRLKIFEEEADVWWLASFICPARCSVPCTNKGRHFFLSRVIEASNNPTPPSPTPAMSLWLIKSRRTRPSPHQKLVGCSRHP